jgi:aminopeptidase
MTPIQLDRYAEVMVWAMQRSRLKAGPHAVYQPGDIVVLRYNQLANSLAERVYRLLLRKKLHVVLRPIVDYRMEAIRYEASDDEQLGYTGSWETDMYRQAHGNIFLYAPESLTYMKDCDTRKQGIAAKALKEIFDIRRARETMGLYGWTLCFVPTDALASQARMSLEEYTHQVVKACYLDDEDPVGRWASTMEKIDRINAWLTDMPIEYVHVKSDDGETDLKVWIGEQRRWIGMEGQNMPSFEVFVSPAAGRAEGRYHSNEPSFRDGHYVQDVRLTFRDGQVVEATAAAEQEFVRTMVGLDEGSKTIGEFSLTDKRFSEITKFMASILYDENVGGDHGNCHIAIGNAYRESFSGDLAAMTPALADQLKFSRSAIHWDLVTTAPRTVTAHLWDGTDVVIYRDGMFTLPM